MGRDLLEVFEKEIKGLENAQAVGVLEDESLITINSFYEMIRICRSGLTSFKFISSGLRNILEEKNIKVREKGNAWFINFQNL